MMNRKTKTLHLALFFTGGVSLKTWDENGIFEREISYYRGLQTRGVNVTFVTYGDSTDLLYADQLPGIRILCNYWGLPPQTYRRWLPVLHAPYLMFTSIIKTHQTVGADRALLASRFLHKKLIARCGYLLSENMAREYGEESLRAQQTRDLEAKLFAAAEQIVVTTPKMKQTVSERYQLSIEKITVIPNYVDVELFKPDAGCQRKFRRICFIGRLDEGKNITALLDAIKGMDVELIVIGDGKLRSKLIEKTQIEHIPAQFLGNLPNGELPQFINSSVLFILPSLIEGHPKVLIEAMACGVPVIGADAPGIRELINHRQTGFLCGTSSMEIKSAIQEVLADSQLMEYMGRQAREYVEEHFSLDHVLEQELKLLHRISRNQV